MRRSLILVLVWVVAGACLLAGCRKELRVEELAGRVTSVGPVYEDADGVVMIHYSVFQNEGLPVDLVLEGSRDGTTWDRIAPCDDRPACSLVGSLSGVPTSAEQRDSEQVVGWRAGAGALASGLQLRLSVDGDPLRGVVWSAAR